ncbi:MAG: 4'-phosphopantetheinyl transferase superfamily protein [Chitinophagaceae bacterium]|nr:4'-phosphopantetheinyl transferase superfamily protein [Chitinophagaceae bacterium]
MPLVYQQNINAVTKMGVWHISETEDFFAKIPLQKEITHWHKRLQHLAGRLLLTELYPNFPLALIQIADTRKPFLANDKYHFSISHCGNYAAAIVSKENRVGADIEMVSAKVEKIMHKFLSDDEKDLILGTDIAKGATLFWSIKESIYKWQGEGGIDFKAHMQIKSLTGNLEEGVAYCIFKSRIQLHVHYLFFNDNFITWVLSDK